MANAEVGSAYVTIMPAMDRSFGKTVEGAMSDAGKKGGVSFEGGMLGSLKGMAGKLAGVLGLASIAKTLYDIGHAAVDAYADFEQLAGGVEVLYGDAAQQVMENANQAFRTAGLSANAYMEQSTSMAAALVNSLGGDTEEAARMADMAITDMADNANRMGTDLSAIQNAYQGFAKQNYTMLDNLKLGYGGTRGEMERLLADAEAISGIHYDIENYDDVVEAIHVIQTEMGVTGATAEEAASTISGSWGMLTASWENLLVSVAGGGEELDAAIRNVVDSLFTWLGNIVPRVGEVIQGMMQAIPGIIEDALPQIGDAVMGFIRDTFGDDTANAVTEFADMVREKFGAMMDRISGHLADFQAVMDEKVIPAFSALKETMQPIIDAVVPAIIEVLAQFGSAVVGLAPIIADFVGSVAVVFNNLLVVAKNVWDGISGAIEGAVEFVTSLVKGDFEGMRDTVSGIFDGILSTARTVWNGIKSAIEGVVKFVTSLVKGDFEGMSDAIGTIFNGIKETASSVWNGISSIVGGVVENIKTVASDAWESVRSTAASIWEGVKSAIETPINSARDIVSGAIEAIKGFFNFEFHWPHIPLPHFSITGSANPLDWITGGLPQIGISWYAKGGIVEGPTLIGAGEKGAEMIWPSYEPYFSRYADALADRMGGGAGTVNYYIDGSMVAADAQMAAALEVVADRARSRRRMGVAY